MSEKRRFMDVVKVAGVREEEVYGCGDGGREGGRGQRGGL